ncbi:MAG: flagellar basal body rod protein FlgF [Nevskia sp.]|nr:flagellar basal body rod protein FlgF [Nevskia sp.]
MDRALYVSMTGATEALRQMAANNNNLANASSTGFRAELVGAQAVQVNGPGLQSRFNVQMLDQGWDSTQGSLSQTGQPLDVALQNGAWLAVQGPDGKEAYTRGGSLHVDAYGQLLTPSGLQVLGDGGPITVPAYSSITIGADGTVSIVPAGQSANTQATVGRLRVVIADQSQIARGGDGLMHANPGVTLDPASGKLVIPGALESSNVNLSASMIKMIQLARQFDMQTRLMKSVEDDASAASSIVRMG